MPTWRSSRWTRRRCAPSVPASGRGLVVVTNLARDQLDRYGELDTTAAHVAAAVRHAGVSGAQRRRPDGGGDSPGAGR